MKAPSRVQWFKWMGLAMLAVVFVALSVGAGGSAVAQAPVAQLAVVGCPSSTVQSSNIVISDVADLYSADLQVSFNKNMLEVAAIDIPTDSVFAAPGVVAPLDIAKFNTDGVISFIATRENTQTVFSRHRRIVYRPVECQGPSRAFLYHHCGSRGWRAARAASVVHPRWYGHPVHCCVVHGVRTGEWGYRLLDLWEGDAAGPHWSRRSASRPQRHGHLCVHRADLPANTQFAALWDWPGIVMAKTGPDGSFSVEVVDKPCQCLYAARRGYLTAQGVPPYPYTGAVAMQDITLLGGDATQDGAINVFDLALIASQYGGADPVGDINGDGKVDIYDLALAAGNSGVARGPQQWSR